MFTGLIEDIGTLQELQLGAEQSKLTVATGLPMAELKLGDSIAVNGACLTVTAFGNGLFTADVSTETVRCTSLGSMTRGSKVNLERALRLSDRLGGHLVTGHVDGQAQVIERRLDGSAWLFRFRTDDQVSALLVAKGSVAVNGISLTVNQVVDNDFTLMVIPHTLEQTTLKSCKVGDHVNIETDLIGKYVARFISRGEVVKPAGVTMDILAKHGFL